MPRRPHLRTFWTSAIVTFAILLAGGHLWALALARGLPPTPALPLTGGTYVGSYLRGSADHYLFRFGIFGFGKRLRESDVILAGTSQVELNLSARQIAQQLGRESPRAQRAFNIGLEFGEGMLFVRDIVERNGLHDKLLVADMYSEGFGTGVSPYAAGVRNADTGVAYAAVAAIWADFVKDWLLDGVLPRLHFYEDPGLDYGHVRLRATRFLGRATLRDWDTGDVSAVWSPTHGDVFHHPPAGLIRRLNDSPPQRPRHDFAPVFSTAFPRDFLEHRHIRPLLIYLPHARYHPEWARNEARRLGYPLIEVAPDGLEFIDDNHMNASGRAKASARAGHALSNERAGDRPLSP